MSVGQAAQAGGHSASAGMGNPLPTRQTTPIWYTEQGRLRGSEGNWGFWAQAELGLNSDLCQYLWASDNSSLSFHFHICIEGIIIPLSMTKWLQIPLPLSIYTFW